MFNMSTSCLQMMIMIIKKWLLAMCREPDVEIYPLQIVNQTANKITCQESDVLFTCWLTGRNV